MMSIYPGIIFNIIRIEATIVGIAPVAPFDGWIILAQRIRNTGITSRFNFMKYLSDVPPI